MTLNVSQQESVDVYSAVTLQTINPIVSRVEVVGFMNFIWLLAKQMDGIKDVALCHPR
jgi:hypothetical protein